MSSQVVDQALLLKEILDGLKDLQATQIQLASRIDLIADRVNELAGIKIVQEVVDPLHQRAVPTARRTHHTAQNSQEFHDHDDISDSPSILPNEPPREKEAAPMATSSVNAKKPSITSRIVLT
jgi:hypothetical protein